MAVKQWLPFSLLVTLINVFCIWKIMGVLFVFLFFLEILRFCLPNKHGSIKLTKHNKRVNQESEKIFCSIMAAIIGNQWAVMLMDASIEHQGMVKQN